MVSRPTPEYSALSATVNQIFIVPPRACARQASELLLIGCALERAGLRPTRSCRSRRCGHDADIEPRGPLGPRGVATISATATIHIQRLTCIEPEVGAVKRRRRPTLVLKTSDAERRRSCPKVLRPDQRAGRDDHRRTELPMRAVDDLRSSLGDALRMR